jgi:NAD(P)-dependent dehydrogenase (short-subunit alcohol dehydrogenase family)
VAEFEGVVAIVTGAAAGIGAATARRLAAEGAYVAVVDRDADGAEAIANEVGGLALPANVADAEAVDTAISTTVERFGQLDVLINNAGVGDLRPLHLVDDKVFRRLLDVNFSAVFFATRAAVPHMLERGRGTIVNVASYSGLNPTRNEAIYSAAKAATIALTKSTALEYGPHIRANCVAPGFVATPLTSLFQAEPATFEPIRISTPLQRMGTADEIADLIAFLASDRASFITGQTIVADGGNSLPQSGTDQTLASMWERFSR